MKRSSVRARIRQLCCLGLPAEMLMVPLLPALRELVPSDLAGFVWVDARGSVRNIYAESLPPPELAPGLHDISGDGFEIALRASILACAESPDEIATTRVDGAAGDHVLCALARTNAGALGQLRLYRNVEHGPFGPRDRADLASVMHYVAQAVAERGAPSPGDPLALAYEDSDEEAMIVADCGGTIHFASDKGLQLLLLATTRDIQPSMLRASVNEGATRAIKTLCARLTSGAGDVAPPVLTLDSIWGRFVIRGYRLSDGHRGEARIGLRVRRQVPMILRFVEAMGHQPLSPQQREIALQIALGRSNHEISARMGVSPNTVAYHIKQLFLRLNVHTRTEAIEKIAWET